MPDDRKNALRLHKSTQGLTDDQLTLLAGQLEIVRCTAGEVVHYPDEPVDELLLVVAGKLTMSFVPPNGVPTAFQELRLDDQFGLLLLESDSPMPVLLTADQNSTLLKISRSTALQLFEQFPTWRRNLFRALGPQLLGAFTSTKKVTKCRIVSFVHTSDETREVTASLLSRLSQVGERILHICDRPIATGATVRTERLCSVDGKMRLPDEIRDLIAAWPDAERVIVEGSLRAIEPWLRAVVDGSGAMYWLFPDQSEEIVSEALKPLVDATPARKEKLFTIRVVNDRLANPSTRLDLLSSRDFKIHKTDHDSDSICRRSEGIERVVHHLRGVSIGLALGGGAARGMAHLGVLQVLQESGIVIDRLSGTSAGSLTGVLYSAGYSASALAEYFAHDLKPAWYYRMLPHGDAIYMLCKYRLGGWDNLLRRYLQDWRLEQLAIPTSVVAADLIEARPVIRRSGDATDAILESINLPGLSRPICRDGMALVDGGVFNVVPADVLVGQDSNVVIASNVAARIMKEFAGNKPGMSTDQMRVPSSYETAARVKTVQDRSLRAVGGRAADIVIEPDVSRVKLTDFKMAIDIAKLGLTSAQAALPAILRKLNAIDPQLFPQTSAGTVKRNAA